MQKVLISLCILAQSKKKELNKKRPRHIFHCLVRNHFFLSDLKKYSATLTLLGTGQLLFLKVPMVGHTEALPLYIPFFS